MRDGRALHSDLPCMVQPKMVAVETEGGQVRHEASWIMYVPRDADIRTNDEVAAVTWGARQITSEQLRVTTVLPGHSTLSAMLVSAQ